MKAIIREILKIIRTFFKKMSLVFFLLLFTYKIIAETNPINPLVTDSLNFSITVKTNIDCFTCDYLAQINDAISISTSAIKDQYDLEGAQFLIPVSLIDCHNSLINYDLQDMMHASEYPQILIKINHLFINKIYKNSGKGTLLISIYGTNNTYQINFKNYFKNNRLIINGNFLIDLNDFNITPPTKFFGLVMVDKIIRINFSLLVNDSNLNRLLTSKDNNPFEKTELNK